MYSNVLDALWQKACQQQYPTHTLYVVAMPIGNLADISIRALATLAQADVIACEDTRHSKGILQQYGISKPLLATHEHNENAAAEQIIERLHGGERIALITDAGTPAISDPGARVVRAVRQAGLRIIPIAGASAVITALSASGIDGAFAFLGFLPVKSGARAQILQNWQHVSAHLVFYEAPHRLHETLNALADTFPECELTIAKELSKLYEHFTHLPMHEVPNWCAQNPEPRGEYVLVLHHTATPTPPMQWRVCVETLLPHLPLKQAVTLTVELTGAPKNEVYSHALDCKKRTD